MRVLNFFLLAAPAVAFLAPTAPKSSNMALQASQRNNEVRRVRVLLWVGLWCIRVPCLPSPPSPPPPIPTTTGV